jgi:hypothetical protein
LLNLAVHKLTASDLACCVFTFFIPGISIGSGSFIRIACIYSDLTVQTFHFADDNEQFVQLEMMIEEKI